MSSCTFLLLRSVCIVVSTHIARVVVVVAVVAVVLCDVVQKFMNIAW